MTDKEFKERWLGNGIKTTINGFTTSITRKSYSRSRMKELKKRLQHQIDLRTKNVAVEVTDQPQNLATKLLKRMIRSLK